MRAQRTKRRRMVERWMWSYARLFKRHVRLLGELRDREELIEEFRRALLRADAQNTLLRAPVYDGRTQ